MTACYQMDPATSGSYGSYYNTRTQTYYAPTTDYFLSVATTHAGANYPCPLDGPKTEKGTYQIAASFCTPKQKNGKEKIIILATHGIGPVRAHWNSPYKPEDYNFVQWAIGQEYSVFFYDRLGNGASQKISSYTGQINTAIAVVQELAKLVRNGKYTGNIKKPNKVALMGFSFGSYTTHGAISLTPEIADAIILTAIGFNKTGLNVNGLVRSFVPQIVNQQNPAVFGDRDNRYLTWVDKFAHIHNYFKKPNYEEATVDFAEAAKNPFSIGEFLTLLSGPQDASKFDKPVLHITGDVDYIFCDGYCYGIFEEPAKTIYSSAKPLQLSLHPGASHHINLHKNATGAFKVITDFLSNNGL
ncbi:alpha/beta-hydrolase [Glonium stellatum]|uniref:Alpha/beta-hydrolase n=1 Tax=Glonium stellatum TaxID=574774 RepID=A0A8E2ESP6_9PEZI|nr:alpha/beta-hydrolase [Glonium stellatum]